MNLIDTEQAASRTMRPPGGPGRGLEGDIQSHLGRQLRAVYDDMVAQPVPDRFARLLEDLERRATAETTTPTQGVQMPDKPTRGDT